MSAPELKPCPFCGVELEHFEDGRRLTHARHPMNGCAFLSGKDWWKVPRFTDPWNTRADLPPTDAEIMAHPKVKALVEAVRRSVPALEDQEADMIVRGYNWTVAEQVRATLAAIQEAKP